MRIIPTLATVATVATIGIAGSLGVAQAHTVGANLPGTFDGTNASPDYMTGITQVYAVTNTGIEIYIPVWSMESCIHEDGSDQDACVWNAETQGNGYGYSVVNLSDDEFAVITTYAAEILAIPGNDVQVMQEVLEDYSEAVIPETNGFNEYGVYVG